MLYRKRVIENTIKRYITSFPAIGLTGPRQSGKTTLLTHMFPDYKYVTFDNPLNETRFSTDPVGFLKEYNNKVIFDEAQYVPEIFRYLKIEIDKNRSKYGNFILTGSSQFELVSKITESLAGRIGLTTIMPYEFNEIDPTDYNNVIYMGSYPELVERNFHEQFLWYASYIKTYINKDVRTISNIGDITSFQNFMNLLAANASQVLDMSYYSRELGISVPTVKRWISILEASYIIFLLPPYYNNLTSRVTKRPKLYFYDTGIVSFLTGIRSYEQYATGPMAGAIFENYIVSEIKKKHVHRETGANLYFIRTADQSEVDLVVENGLERQFIEIKKSATFAFKMLTSIKKFKREKDRGFLIYNGEDIKFENNINALNYKNYLSLIE